MYKKVLETCKKALKANLLRLIQKETCCANKKIYERFLADNM